MTIATRPLAARDQLTLAMSQRKRSTDNARAAADQCFVTDIESIMDQYDVGPTAVADMLGVSRTNVHRLLRLYGSQR